MHHFTKHFKKKLWYHVLLPIASALVTVAILDIMACFSWLYKDYAKVVHFNDGGNQNMPLNIMDILYWIFVTYRVILSLLLCICGIFMGRKLIVVVWLLVSMIIDAIHLSETIFVISKPALVQTWPLFLAVSSAIWGELKIVRIKYRIIRRTINIDWNNNVLAILHKIDVNSLKNVVTDNKQVALKNDFKNEYENCQSTENNNTELEDDDSVEFQNIQDDLCIQTNAVNFIKLARNLYNLLTWHLTGFLFGGDFHMLISKNHKAVFLEQKVIRYARIFLDSLTVVYILQEKKLLVTPWIMMYIFSASAGIAIFLFILLQLNLMTSLFIGIYYLVFSIDLFFRSGFLLYCIKLIIRSKELI